MQTMNSSTPCTAPIWQIIFKRTRKLRDPSTCLFGPPHRNVRLQLNKTNALFREGCDLCGGFHSSQINKPRWKTFYASLIELLSVEQNWFQWSCHCCTTLKSCNYSRGQLFLPMEGRLRGRSYCTCTPPRCSPVRRAFALSATICFVCFDSHLFVKFVTSSCGDLSEKLEGDERAPDSGEAILTVMTVTCA